MTQPPSRPLRSSHLAQLAVLLLGLYLLWHRTHWPTGHSGPFESLLLLAPFYLAVYAAWRASRRVAANPRLRRAWVLIAVALACQATGGAVALVYEHLLDGLPNPSAADLLYLAFYPLLLTAVLSFPAARRSRRETLELALDCTVVGLGGAAVFVYFVLGTDALAAGTPLQATVAVAYPVGNAVALAGLGAAMLGRPNPALRRTLTVIAAAIGTWLVADLVYGYASLHGDYEAGHPVDAVYVLAFTLFTIAAARQGAPLEATPETEVVTLEEAREHSPLPTFAAVGLCLAIAVAAAAGESFPQLAIAVIAAAVTVLVLWRQVLALTTLRQSRARLDEAQRLAQLGSWEWDVERDRTIYSEEALRIHGATREGMPSDYGASLATVHPDDRERVDQAIETVLRDAKPGVFETRIVRPDGELRTIVVHVDVTTRNGRVTRMHGTNQDVTDRRRTEEELRFRAEHDQLTGLFNRARLTRALDESLDYAARFRRPVAVMALDVDNFKLLNDTYGHEAGDEILRHVASVLHETVGGANALARVGADEFAVVLPEVDERGAMDVVAEIEAALRSRDRTPPVHVSGGIAVFDGREDLIAEDLLVAADIALFNAKQKEDSGFCVYDGAGSETRAWVERIRTALTEDRFVLFAQPIVEIGSGRVARHELLIRMLGEDGGIVPPGQFLPTAERLGVITEIDRWVTGEGLALARGGVAVSINLSGASVGDRELVAAVREATESGVDADLVAFELTETAATTNLAAAREFIQELTDLGCDIALDDFGTGFGSFSYLKHLPARLLKIDREFVRDVAFNSTDQQVVKSITEIAHTLNKVTVAEGVEDAAALEALREYGVDYAQGFHIGRPRPASEVVQVA